MLLKNISKWEKIQKKKMQEQLSAFQEGVDEGTEKNYDFNEFSQDIFSSLYQVKPEAEENVTAGKAWAKQALDILGELSEFKKLRDQGAILNSFESGLGAAMLTKYLSATLPARELPNPDNVENEIKMYEDFLRDYPDSPEAGDFPGRIQKLKGQLENAKEAWAVDDSEEARQALRMKMRGAVQAALSEIAETNQNANPFGFGTEPGKDGYAKSEAKLALAQKVKHNRKIQDIAALAGRFQREALHVQANKKNPGPDEITDVETGNDLGRILPSEMMKVNDPCLQYDFFRGFLEGSLLQYRLDSCEKEVKGPIVVCIDNSGSMRGAKETWSKAIALAMCTLAVEQKRPFEIIHFDTAVQRVDAFDTTDVDSNRLVDSCMFFSDGGTMFAPALERALTDIKSNKVYEKADVILITDGEAPLAPEFIEAFNKAKGEIGCHLYSIALRNMIGVLAEVSDRYLEIKDLRDDADAKETVFSI